MISSLLELLFYKVFCKKRKLKLILVVFFALIFIFGVYLRDMNYAKRKVNATEMKIRNIRILILTYKENKGFLPQRLNDLNESNFRNKNFEDAWGSEYNYKITDAIKEKFIIQSAGQDKIFFTDDDLFY